jgi:hypothetical protein
MLFLLHLFSRLDMIRRPSSLEAVMCIALDSPAFLHLSRGDQVNNITSQTSLLLLLIVVFRAPPPPPLQLLIGGAIAAAEFLTGCGNKPGKNYTWHDPRITFHEIPSTG